MTSSNDQILGTNTNISLDLCSKQIVITYYVIPIYIFLTINEVTYIYYYSNNLNCSIPQSETTGTQHGLSSVDFIQYGIQCNNITPRYDHHSGPGLVGWDLGGV